MCAYLLKWLSIIGNFFRVKQIKSLIKLCGALNLIAGLKLSILRAGGQPSIIIEVIAAVISYSILSSNFDTNFFSCSGTTRITCFIFVQKYAAAFHVPTALLIF